MAEVNIHCNVISCRKSLSTESHASVTCCSHIFCLECANKAFTQALVCPECGTNLTGSDDIVITKLNPSEEYKSFVLAGLRPEIIMDICSRAVSFYEYQVSQEINYRTLLQKKVERRFNALYEEYSLATRDLNYMIKTEKEKQTELTKEYELEKRKNQDLDSKFQEKSKQFQKLQLMYEKLKRKFMATASSSNQMPKNNNLNTPLTTSSMANPSYFRSPLAFQPEDKGQVRSENISRVGTPRPMNRTPKFTNASHLNPYQSKPIVNDTPFYGRRDFIDGRQHIGLSSMQSPSLQSYFKK